MRAVLGQVLPVIRERTAGLRAELERSRALRATAEQAAASLAQSHQDLKQRQAALQRLEAQKRLAAQDYRANADPDSETGQASSTESVCQARKLWVVAVSLTQTKQSNDH